MGSNSTPKLNESVRNAILEQPQAVLEDGDILRALVGANARDREPDVISLNSVAMERLTARITRLEENYRCVTAAAYDSISDSRLVQQAVLEMLEPKDFEGFLRGLKDTVAKALDVDHVLLVLGRNSSEEAIPKLRDLGAVLRFVAPDFVDSYSGPCSHDGRMIGLRALPEAADVLYGADRHRLKSEACLRLSLGSGRLPAMFLMASAKEGRFHPQQGTDLLDFFASALERRLRHWL